jgi:hypothetical protein
MSIKKTIQISFLLFANLILLAHTIVPHHHHEDASICFCHTPTHQHKENPASGKCCTIDNTYISKHNNLKITFRLPVNHDSGQILYALILNTLNIRDFTDDTLIRFQQNPYVPLYYSEFVALSIGLRAPPAC